MIYKRPDLHDLSVIVERGASLPSVMLPNLAYLVVKYDHDGDWLPLFRGATLERLEAVSFYPRSEQYLKYSPDSIFVQGSYAVLTLLKVCDDAWTRKFASGL